MTNAPAYRAHSYVAKKKKCFQYVPLLLYFRLTNETPGRRPGQIKLVSLSMHFCNLWANLWPLKMHRGQGKLINCEHAFKERRTVYSEWTNCNPGAVFTTFHFRRIFKLEFLSLASLSSLIDPLESNEENVALWIGTQVSYSQYFIFFVTFKWAQ